MKDRSQLLGVTILALAVVAVYLNLGFFKPGFEHSGAVRRRLAWQGEVSQRSLELREGLDLQGGLQVLLEADTSTRELEFGDLDRAAGIIETRINALGVTEPLVQTQGADKIVVELPGVADPDLAVRTIGQTALLEFIYAGDRTLRPGDEVTTSWGAEGLLFHELPEEKQVPYTLVVTDTERAGEPDSAGVAEEPDVAEEDTSGAVAATEALTASGVITATGEVTDSEDASLDVTEAAAVAPTELLTGTGEVTPTVEGAVAITDTAADTMATGSVTATEAATVTAAAEERDEAEPVSPEAADQLVYPSVVTGDYLSAATVGLDQFSKPSVNFSLSLDGGSHMQTFTRDHIDETMAIALDGKIISAPTVRDVIATNGQITGDFSQAEADALVAQLRSGALPVALNVVGQTLIGPTLGRESVTDAVQGGVVGFLVVMVFMLLYYRFPGFLADVALMLYALLTLSVFRLIPVTLTLAGIAGFILSIGIAVDANILIFERMKEELRAGRRIRAAMDIGFSRAWPSIRDSNLSTLITCAILFWFGNQFGASIVKGFAVTLAIGVMVSLFTAITVTRNLLRLANRIVLREEGDADTMESARLRALFGF